MTEMPQEEIDFEVKTIHDPIHHSINLSEIEVKIINTRAFQRLRNIKQLGLINYVFPGADYTRFSHSIGTSYLASELYDAHSRVRSTSNDKEKQKFRLAGLLHDIGHYPFSHAMENAIKLYSEKYQLSGIIEKKDSESIKQQTPENPIRYLTHESVGREVLLNDDEICTILKDDGFEPEEIYHLFTRDSEIENKTNLISSDLDADRLDYLLRSAYHVGLPYGFTDIEYILRQITTDESGKICIDQKALRTVDHFLLCRYFDYSQVIFHKTVAGFEEVLKSVIVYLINEKKINYSPDSIISSIKSGEWYEYDDSHIANHIRILYKDDNTPEHIKIMMKSIIERKPPKEIAKMEYIGETDKKSIDEFKVKISDLENLVEKISEKFDINKENIFVWNNGALEITKIGKTLEISKSIHLTEEDADKINQTVRIHNRISKESLPIMERDDSLMNILSGKALYSVRLFVLFDFDQFNEKNLLETKIKDIVKFIDETIPNREWK